jgi:hypothetical protein
VPVCGCVGCVGREGKCRVSRCRCLVPPLNPPPPFVVGVEDDEYLIIYRLKIVSLHSSLVWYTFGSTFDLRTFFTLTQRELPDRRGIEQGKARSCLKFLLVLYVIKMKCRRLFKFHTVRILYILVYIYI